MFHLLIFSTRNSVVPNSRKSEAISAFYLSHRYLPFPPFFFSCFSSQATTNQGLVRETNYIKEPLEFLQNFISVCLALSLHSDRKQLTPSPKTCTLYPLDTMATVVPHWREQGSEPPDCGQYGKKVREK